MSLPPIKPLIEDGIPVPRKLLKVDPFRLNEMRVGQSILHDVKYRETLYYYARRDGIKITVRQVDRDHLRVWRRE